MFIEPHPQPLRDEAGNMIGAVNLLVDISDKRKKELQIRENETSYRLLSESLARKVEERTMSLKKSEERYFKMIEEVEDYAIILLDKDGLIQNWNKGAEKIKGYKEEEIIGKHFRIFYLDSDQQVFLPEKLIMAATQNGKAMHEGWRVRKDGSMFWGYIIITALHSSTGEIIGFSKVTRDLTERKLAEDQLREYAHNIGEQNKQLEEFAYITSHDLQEPLRKIHIFSGIIEEQIENKEVVATNLTKIKAASARMNVLIRDILKYSRLSQTDDLFVKTDLNGILRNAKQDLDLLIEEKNAVIHSGDLPVINGVAVQLHQLFFNLIGNSLKFSKTAPVISVTAEILHVGAAPDALKGILADRFVKLVFSDNGIGFEQQYHEKVFRMFQRLSDNKSGTGIGLALCKKIVENHHGTISVTSESGKGSVFTIFLPM